MQKFRLEKGAKIRGALRDEERAKYYAAQKYYATQSSVRVAVLTGSAVGQ